MDKYDKIFFILLIFEFILGIIGGATSNAVDGRGMPGIMAFIVIIYAVYLKYIKKAGHYSRMLGILGNVLLAVGVAFVGPIVGSLI